MSSAWSACGHATKLARGSALNAMLVLVPMISTDCTFPRASLACHYIEPASSLHCYVMYRIIYSLCQGFLAYSTCIKCSLQLMVIKALSISTLILRLDKKKRYEDALTNRMSQFRMSYIEN